jgi:hypothetical protein
MAAVPEAGRAHVPETWTVVPGRTEADETNTAAGELGCDGAVGLVGTDGEPVGTGVGAAGTVVGAAGTGVGTAGAANAMPAVLRARTAPANVPARVVVRMT